MAQPELPVSTDVLVVGAGPAGLALSTALAMYGVDHLTIERLDSVARGAKAVGIQPRTLEYLSCLGVADELIHAGLPGTGFAVHEGDQTLLRAPFDRLPTPYPFALALPQQQTEEILQEHALRAGARLHRGWRLLDWSADYPGVDAMVAGPDGVVRAVRARYIAGADGVYSTVRDRAGIAFTGTSPAQLYALADVRLRPAPDDLDIGFFLGEGLLLVSVLPGGAHRIVASIPPGTVAPSTPAAIESLLDRRAGRPYRGTKVAEILSTSTYHVQQRVAEKFVDGPVVLLGDAAHTHSPAGGQGMNTGLQDSANLAWRLSEICVHGARADLLQEYHTERHPVAEDLIAFTGGLNALVDLPDPGMRRLRDITVRAIGASEEVTDWIAHRLSQLTIGYAPDGPGSRFDPSLLAEPPAGYLGWLLADPEATSTMQAGRTLVVPAPKAGDATLVRPDGYIAAVGPEARRRAQAPEAGR